MGCLFWSLPVSKGQQFWQLLIRRGKQLYIVGILQSKQAVLFTEAKVSSHCEENGAAVTTYFWKRALSFIRWRCSGSSYSTAMMIMMMLMILYLHVDNEQTSETQHVQDNMHDSTKLQCRILLLCYVSYYLVITSPENQLMILVPSISPAFNPIAALGNFISKDGCGGTCL